MGKDTFFYVCRSLVFYGKYKRRIFLDKFVVPPYTEQSSDWGDFVYTAVISKDKILQASKVLIQQEGWTAVNIRRIASACHVSIGSVYNYFSSKDDLLSAVVESVWYEIFHDFACEGVQQNIQECIVWIYKRMAWGNEKYPDFFSNHSIGFMGGEKKKGHQKMQQVQKHMTEVLCQVLKQDSCIRPDAFTAEFKPEDLADILFSVILSALIRKDYNPAVVLQLLQKILY